jgi:thioredoxin reductase
MSEITSDVAIIGGGPAGIAAACELRRKGAGRVVLLDREVSAGGTPRHCGHPPFGWREFFRVLTGPAYARKLVERARTAGVEVRIRHTVVALREGGLLETATPEGPLTIRARRVILATGARESPPSARLISGDRPIGCLTTGALQSFIYLQGLLPFRRPVIVGTEYVSLSAILTCRRAGIKPVAIVEANRRPSVPRPLGLLPGLLRIPAYFGAELARIHGRGRVEGVTVRLASGEMRDLACDGVLFTGRFVPEAAVVEASHLVVDSGSKGPSIDQYGRCSDPAYFAAGNILRAVETAGWSYAEGVRVGRMVAADLAGGLPARAHELSVSRGAGVKLVVPQRIQLPVNGSGLDDLQLRLDGAVSGSIQVEVDDALVWQREVNGLPDRRLLVPLAGIPLPAGATSIRVAVRPNDPA